ncbi:hypothetical protein Vretimale_19138 [Volvox reticuliferus]|uniref:Uncharacterized protein n=1 Tax=Volvox reticuliferus TaxID=1737510 RepID=A0A8J4FSL1_9CHLO|nr:hypothetical protein Vretifemale_16461 [Volvox reticuliferus]GIM16495.1 hypothetical protein Vretimale_19138 [Volvox reticuliferus]
MAQQLLILARQASRARSQLLALAAASAGLAAYGASEAHTTAMQFSIPGLTPVAMADAKAEAQRPASKPPATVSIALAGFEDVKDVNGFVTSALQKTLKYQKNSPVQSIVSAKRDGVSTTPSPLNFGEQLPVPIIEPAAFYAQLEKQPLSEKIMILDDIVDSVILEAQRSAEVSGLTVGMLGGGVACYALLGWWSDLALPGVGTVACSALAGAAGHNRAKVAAKRTRTRLLTAILDNQPAGLRNAFIDYLSAPSLDVKQRIASDVKPAVFFRDFFLAVQPLLKQGKEEAAAAARAVLVPLE